MIGNVVKFVGVELAGGFVSMSGALCINLAPLLSLQNSLFKLGWLPRVVPHANFLLKGLSLSFSFWDARLTFFPLSEKVPWECMSLCDW